ncbi:MAG: hydrogenase maturation protease, partial [Planctomycetes bacterium]|nr:hydrogenase maturation protease [Planctomycetota bacterium]
PKLMDLMEGRSKAVIVDAVDADGPPGMVYRFRPDEAVFTQTRKGRSLHEPNVLHYLELAEALGMAPGETVIIGIQPESFSPGEKLSPSVEQAVPKAAELVLAELCRLPEINPADHSPEPDA